MTNKQIAWTLAGISALGLAIASATIEDFGSTVAGFAVLAALGLAYVAPSIIASFRGHHNLGAIIAVNVLLGWTMLGWVVAFVWSLTDPAPVTRIVTTYQVGDVVNGHRFNGQTWQPL